MFDTAALASRARVDLDTVKAMIGCQSVKKEDAQKILAALSTLLHQDYTLDTVYVCLIEESESKSDIARIRALIDAEYRSGYQAMHGLALGISQHPNM